MEDKHNEYKREYTDDIKYAVIAFANTEGGKIYIGVNDDGSIFGVENPDDIMLRLTNMVRDNIRPDVTMFTDIAAEKIDGKNVIVLTVLRGTACPYYLGKKGIRPEGVYIRQGSSSVPASETVILKMIRETAGDKFEDARSLNQQLTFNQTSAYFAKNKLEFGPSQMRSLHLIGADETFTNLGMLLSDQCVPTIKMAVFEGSRKTIFHDRKEVTGSLISQMEQAFSFLDQYNRTRAEFSDLYRIDKKDYPPEALREALLNAIVHRDYSINSSILISIFDDRIEFVSIGGLVKGLSYDDLFLGVSVLRNEHLANIFYRLKLIEAYGTGMLKIHENYAGFSQQPKIEVSANAFKITLPNKNYSVNNETGLDSVLHETGSDYVAEKDRINIVLNLLDRKAAVTRKEVETILNVSQATAALLLRKMLDMKLISKSGSGKNVYYQKH